MSWILVVAGSVSVIMLAESWKLHNEVGPYGGHHSDVAVGLSLLGFSFRMAPFILAFAGISALLAKSTSPLIGAVFGLVATIPVGLVLGILNILLLYVSPWVADRLPFAVGIALVVMGFMRKPKEPPVIANQT